jgi:uncharacterized protein YukE
MPEDIILANYSELSSSGSSIGHKATHVDTLTSSIQSATGKVSDSLSGTSALSSADAELQQLQTGITTIMGCLSDALTALGNNLQNAAQEFKASDSALAAMFSSLDQSLQPYIGYDNPPPVAPKAQQPAQKQQGGGRHWWSQALDITEGVGLGLAGAAAVVAGGGPEDPLSDAAAVAAEEQAAELIGAGSK